jgi:hypothetical protein
VRKRLSVAWIKIGTPVATRSKHVIISEEESRNDIDFLCFRWKNYKRCKRFQEFCSIIEDALNKVALGVSTFERIIKKRRRFLEQRE